jgi:TatA/E family protein of Tat protein translocase
MNQNLLYAFGMPGGTELILIVLAILLLFPGNIGKLGQSLGSGIKNFRKAMQGEDQGEEETNQQKQPTQQIENKEGNTITSLPGNVGQDGKS